MTTFPCPIRLTIDYPDELIELCRKILEAESNIELLAHHLRFVDPFGIALLGATFYMLQQRNRTIQVSGLPESVSGYLQRMDVFPGVSLINSKTQQGRHDRRDSLMELTRLDKRSQIDRAANQIANSVLLSPTAPMLHACNGQTRDIANQYIVGNFLVNKLRDRVNNKSSYLELNASVRVAHPNGTIVVKQIR